MVGNQISGARIGCAKSLLLCLNVRHGEKRGQMLNYQIATAKGQSQSESYGYGSDKEIGDKKPVADAPKDVAAEPADCQYECQYEEDKSEKAGPIADGVRCFS